ncbi:MAG: TetR/AcrR family transcriptional regulator [Sphaerochaetaceae bacterium]|nr:TetR/AcrR family transcriptional regulator [Sphaerochaetaceae bacterium]
MSIKDRKERERHTLKEKILRATGEIVSERGLEHLTIRSLAERIEYSPRTVYLYFRDKQEVLEAFIEQRFRSTWEEMQKISSSVPALSVIRIQIEGHLRMALEHPEAYRILNQLLVTPSHVPGVYQKKVENHAKNVLEEYIGRTDSLEALTATFLSALRGISVSLVQASSNLSHEDIEQRIATATDVLLRGIPSPHNE